MQPFSHNSARVSDNKQIYRNYRPLFVHGYTPVHGDGVIPVGSTNLFMKCPDDQVPFAFVAEKKIYSLTRFTLVGPGSALRWDAALPNESYAWDGGTIASIVAGDVNTYPAVIGYGERVGTIRLTRNTIAVGNPARLPITRNRRVGDEPLTPQFYREGEDPTSRLQGQTDDMTQS